MTVQDKPAAAKLSFGDAISTAHENVFRRFPRFATLAAVPFILALIVTVLKFPASQILPGGDIVFLVLDMIPFALLGLALSRAVLTGEAPGFLPPEPFGRRTWVYLGYSLLMLLAAAVPIILLVIAAAGAAFVTNSGSQEPVGWGWPILLGVVGFFAVLYLVARFSLVFPALSVDEKLGLRGSWRLTKGNGLKLVGLQLAILAFMALAGIVGSLVLGTDITIKIGGSLEIPPGASLMDALIDAAPGVLWGALVSFGSFGLAIGAYSSAFAQLSGWGRPREEILERFE